LEAFRRALNCTQAVIRASRFGSNILRAMKKSALLKK